MREQLGEIRELKTARMIVDESIPIFQPFQNIEYSIETVNHTVDYYVEKVGLFRGIPTEDRLEDFEFKLDDIELELEDLANDKVAYISIPSGVNVAPCFGSHQGVIIKAVYVSSDADIPAGATLQLINENNEETAAEIEFIATGSAGTMHQFNLNDEFLFFPDRAGGRLERSNFPGRAQIIVAWEYKEGVGNIAGTVLDLDTGDPVEDVSVFCDGQMATTDHNGDYLVANVEAMEDLDIEFEKDGYAPLKVPVMVGPGQQLEVNVSLSPFVATVTGAVIDYVSGQPITGALIQAGDATARTDASGEYSIRVGTTADGEPADYELSFRRPNYEQQFAILELKTGDDVELDVELRRAILADDLRVTAYVFADQPIDTNDPEARLIITLSILNTDGTTTAATVPAAPADYGQRLEVG